MWTELPFSEQSMKTVVCTNSDVQIVILFTPDRQADSSEYDHWAPFSF